MGLIYKQFTFFTDTDVYESLIPDYMHPKSIKKCPNHSRIVMDTKYISNSRTINLKINMFVPTFFIPPPAIQQQKPSSGAKKIYSTKLKIFFFYSSKIKGPKDPISSLCYVKNQCVVFCTPKHLNLFISVFFVTYLKVFRHVMACDIWYIYIYYIYIYIYI